MNHKPSNTPSSVLLPLVEPKNSLSSSLLCSSAFGIHLKHSLIWDKCEFPQADLDAAPLALPASDLPLS